MKYKILIITISIIFCSGWAIAQDKYSTKFNIKDSRNNDFSLEIGFEESATDGLDDRLGEKELPPFTPPGDDMAVILLITDTTYGEEEIMWVQVDYRSSYTKDYPVVFNIKVLNPYEYISFYWDHVPDIVDSAFLEDPIDEVDIIKINMKETNSALIDLNVNFIRDFRVKYWLKGSHGAEEEEISYNNIKIYPNPAPDYFNISAEEPGYYKIYNSIGSEILTGRLGPGLNRIDIQALSIGYYTISVFTEKMFIGNEKLIKL